MSDRELLAAAQRACDAAGLGPLHQHQRPHPRGDRPRPALPDALPQADVHCAARSEIGLDPAYVYGLIRQESRFVMDARSQRRRERPDADHAGHRALDGTQDRPGLHAGHDHRPRRQPAPGHQLPEARARRLRRLAGDGRGRLQRRAEAGRAAGARARCWSRPIWAENIPFNETRDYVKKVLQQRRGTTPAIMSGTPAPSLKARLGSKIGPRDPAAPARPTRNLPLSAMHREHPGPRRYGLRRPQRLREAGRAQRRCRWPHRRAHTPPRPAAEHLQMLPTLQLVPANLHDDGAAREAWWPAAMR